MEIKKKKKTERNCHFIRDSHGNPRVGRTVTFRFRSISIFRVSLYGSRAIGEKKEGKGAGTAVQ